MSELHIVHMQYIITEIQNGCQSTTMSWINPKIEQALSTAAVHNPMRFHEDRLKTFHIILLMGKQTDRL